MSVAFVLWRRSLNEVLRVRGALLPATIAPLVFMLGITGQFGRLTGLDGFPTDSYLSWIVPLSCLQGAGFAGAATGSNLARDIEQGWFDRLLVAPVPRPLLVIGPILGAVTRSMVLRTPNGLSQRMQWKGSSSFTMRAMAVGARKSICGFRVMTFSGHVAAQSPH